MMRRRTNSSSSTMSLDSSLTSTQYQVSSDTPSIPSNASESKSVPGRWRQVVAGVGANIGSMIISEDMVRGLKYCLQWLQVFQFNL